MRGVDQQFSAVRAELLQNISGHVLDLGAGAGPHWPYLAANARVTKITALEPNAHLHKALAAAVAAAAAPFPIEVTLCVYVCVDVCFSVVFKPNPTILDIFMKI